MAKQPDLCVDGKGHVEFINEGIGKCIKCGREKDYPALQKAWENRYRTKMGEGGRRTQKERRLKPREVFA